MLTLTTPFDTGKQSCWNFYKIAFSDLQSWLGPWVGLFWFLLILVLLSNIWLSVKWQIQVPARTAGNHQTFFRNSNRSVYNVCMNSTDVYFIPVSHIRIPKFGWYVHCASEYQVSGLRQLLIGSFLPENGPKMSNEALFDIDQLQECMVPKSSLLDDDWWWSCAYLSVGPMKFKKSLKEQMCN